MVATTLGFSLYIVPFVYHVVIILDKKKSKLRVSADFGVLLLNTGNQVQ